MRFHRRNAVPAMAIFTAATTFGGVAAQADSAARLVPGPTRTAALRAAPHDRPGPWGAYPHTRPCDPPYLADDSDLGPKVLPRTGFLGRILRGYVPLGGLSPQHFLSRYWNYAKEAYRYPPRFGFARSGNWPNGRWLTKKMTLYVGTKVDRFGGPGGSYLSPLGVLFIKRALPPSNLNTNNSTDPMHICGYHAYIVTKAFPVDSGPAAPAFEMPGGGTQYHLRARYVKGAPPNPKDEVSVGFLVRKGYLAPIEPALVGDDTDMSAGDDHGGGPSFRPSRSRHRGR